ncbi:TPA: hypothetical protein L6954_002875, partial [Listeria monocytogenes]|nr:hypothetical protein [Listeria monocytogenes]EAG5016705.1 hypothetical protein [Listeria monocytogenes]EGC7822761.1 hypothetical protein [Listeria monocytogenes]HBP9522139.1 hypothetical protein [Listeria monocytogenes]
MEVGSLAEWVSGIGTISAVIVSLYLANKKPKRNLEITCKIDEKNFIGEGKNYDDEVVKISITNLNFSPICIQNIYFKDFSKKIFELRTDKREFDGKVIKLPKVIYANSSEEIYFRTNDLKEKLKESK